MNHIGHDPSHWKLGFFYFNKNDKRMFPPKRIGLGWTVNFANPSSVIVFSLISAGIVIIGFFLKK
ncbi:DUF5808 domain-containing protein [uncultured Chryseobacterium sp.]|uniref:DUF5808 domain-containing protein n=1 Tax=uncultured Chryseobacterium sp. TaxID=259322 RepID=UPI00345C29C0